MSSMYISESVELPINSGTLEVDTSDGSVTIFMKPIPEPLKITKVPPTII